MNRLKKTLKFLVYALLVLLLLFALSWLLLQFPSVQTKVVNKVTDQLSESLDTKIHIESVNIRFFKTIVLEDIYIEDQQKDTLLVAKELSTDIELFSLFSKKILLNHLLLKNADIRLRKQLDATNYNFDFIKTALQPKDNAPKSKWLFGLNKISILQTNLNLLDENNASETDVSNLDLTVDINQLDFDEKNIDINTIQLKNSKVRISNNSKPAKESQHTSLGASSKLEFPKMPWKLSIAQIELKDNCLQMEQAYSKIDYDGIDLKNFELCSISGNINQFIWENKNIATLLSNFSFNEKAGFEVQDLKVNLALDSSSLHIDDLLIETKKSKIQNSTKIVFEEFDDLIKWNASITMNSRFPKSKIAIADLKLFVKDWKKRANILDSQFLELEGNLKLKDNSLSLTNLITRLPGQVDLATDLTLHNFADIKNIGFNVDLKKLSTSYAELNAILPTVKLPVFLEDFGEYNLSMKAVGKLSDFKATEVEFNTETETSCKADFHITGLPEVNNLKFEIDAKEINTKAENWSNLFKGKVPGILDSLGNVKYSGLLNGDLKSIVSDGRLFTDIGELKSDLEINFTDDYKSANYSGELMLEEFELGTALADTRYGTATVYLIGDGEGFQLAELKANLEAVVEQLEWNGYLYEHLSIEGDFREKVFNGKANFQDDNAELDFVGFINLKDSIPDFEFSMSVDTLDLKALNLITQDIKLSGQTQMNFSGNGLANLDGNILITDLVLSDSSQTYREDSLFLEARELDANTKILAFNSNFLEANVKGNFDLDLLKPVAINFINDYFPISTDTAFTREEEIKISEQKFDFNVNLIDPTPLKYSKIPALAELTSATLAGDFDFQKRNLNLKAILIEPSFKNIQTDTLSLVANASKKQFKTEINASQFQTAFAKVPFLNIKTNLANDSLSIGIDAQDSIGNHPLTTSGIAVFDQEEYIFHFDPKLVLNDQIWSIGNQNVFYYAKNYLFADQFFLEKSDHRIVLQSEGTHDESKMNPINLEFDNYDLSELTELIGQKQETFEGHINGFVKIKDLFKNINYEVDLDVDDLQINKDTVGNLNILAAQQEIKSLVQLELNLEGSENNLFVKGNYDLARKNYNLNGQIDALQISTLNPFTKGIISNSKGILSGNLILNGSLEKPQLRSTLLISEASTTIDYFNIPINIPRHQFQLDERKITLGNVNLLGENNKTAQINGSIKHDFFTNWNMDLGFQTEDFKLLNTTEEDNSIFWGTLNLKTDVKIDGPFEKPFINVNATTLPQSNFYIQTLLEDDILAEVPYLTFGNPYAINEDSIVVVSQQTKVKNKAQLDLQMNLLVTPDAQLQLIIDPQSGDQVNCRGNSNMTVKLNPAGELSVLGEYIIESGAYHFSYGQFIKKEFAIEPGSRVSFAGDPLESQLAITASYSTNASVAVLVKNETTFSETESENTSKRTLIKTLLKLNGDLLKPIVTFDIQIPENDGNVTNSAVSRKLIQMRNDPAEMNKQVFALLLFNNFFPTSNAGEILADAGENLALSSVSKIVTNQLNKLASNLIKGVEIKIDLDSYKSGNLSTDGNLNYTTELQVGLEKKLFNDRLTIKAGADVDLSSNSDADLTNLAGDFVLEYKLNESGNYLLLAFRKSDFDVLRDENTSRNGIGFSAKKSFGKKGKKKKK